MLNDCELESLRATADSALPDYCEIRRQATGTFDPLTGLYTATGAIVFEGCCRIGPVGTASDSEVNVGDLAEVLGRFVLTLPYTAVGIDVDDVVTFTTASDPDLVGRSLYVAHVLREPILLSRRVIIEDREMRV